jgi:hypothetical protein
MLGPSALQNAVRRIGGEGQVEAAINRFVRRLSARPVRHPKPSDQGPRRSRRRSRCFRQRISWKGDCRTSSRYRPSRHTDRTPNDNLDRLCRRTRRTPGWRQNGCYRSSPHRAIKARSGRSRNHPRYGGLKGMEPLPLAGVDSSGSANRESSRISTAPPIWQGPVSIGGRACRGR